MTRTTLFKGLLGATALTVFTAGSAHAQFTPAGTNVQNTFSLTYDVGGVEQPVIDTGPGGTDAPTEFTVDRLVDLTVLSQGDNTVAPGASNQELAFSVTNNGNDTQAYSLTIIEESPGGTEIDTDDPVGATPVLVYYLNTDGDTDFEPGGDDGAPIPYDPANPPVVAPDETIWVVVTQDIPVPAVDGNTADITLVADTLDPVSFVEVTADGDGNALVGVAENVLADGQGTNDTDNAGDHSDTGTYIIVSAVIAADKAVTVFSENGDDCVDLTAAATGGYAIPGACVEYVISVQNTGSADATDIVINDDLPIELIFAAAELGGDFTGGSFVPVLPTTNTDCATKGDCEINLTGASLPAPATAGGTTTGTVTIRAFVK